MKKLLTILMLCIISLGYSQEFLGIKVEGKLHEVVSKFKAKGFILTNSQKNAVQLSGKVQNSKVDIVIISSPKSYTVWKFAVYLPKRSTWYSLLTEYDDYVELFENKYGQPSSVIERFEDPYYDGDGFELLALNSEKAIFSTYWLTDIVSYSVKIDSSGCVKLNYENTKNSKIHDKEKTEQDYSTF